MKCPNCGAEIPEGKMYCESCGAELQIVPDIDLDLDIQNEMDSTLQSIADEEFNNNEEDDDDIDFDDDPNLLSMIFSGHAGGKLFYGVLIVIFVGIVIGAVILGKRISTQNTLDYQLEMAEEAKNSNNLLDAISYLEEAYKLDPDAEYLFTIADYYYTLGRENDAIYTLMDIANGDFSNSEVVEAYSKVITLYEESENYQLIADILSECSNQAVIDAYSKYMVCEPEFNYEAGTYNETLILKLSAEGNGTIYYSTDASEPDENSNVYEEPIFLEYGSYTVNAVYVNEFGIKSDVVTNKYLIDVDFVFEPTILTDSGNYSKATLIEAEVPVMYTLYYTTDGSDPDKNSNKYTDAIAMPLGETTYKFREYASDGTESSIVERTYNLTIDTAINADNAVSWLKGVLVEKGINSDLDGHREGDNGYYIYVFTTAYNISGVGDYFFIVEYHIDAYGNTTKTNVIYAMNVTNANDLQRVIVSNSNYTLVNF